ncbi:MAG: diguanylate cyclase [Planctomycetaceae bacterium]|nr:diguanylate cyclase [Planctomycetaceae bacterium]
MNDLLQTRFSQTLSFTTGPRNWAEQPCRLVRIYPASNIGQVVDLTGQALVIGRDADSHLELPDDSVSRRHALLEPKETGYLLTDLDSTNGTYVNDTRITSRQLQPGDRVRFGNQIFKFLATDEIEAEYHETVYKIMTTDGLTQAFNKRYFSEVLEREFVRSQRTNRPLSLLVIDLDKFKSVNDTYGHLAGDEVLSELCRRIKQLLRRDEVLARFGGEEFALILADTSLEEACQVAERIRACVAAEPFVTDQATIPVTTSIGAAEATRQPLVKVSQFLELADQKLYVAKQGGRNRVVA